MNPNRPVAPVIRDRFAIDTSSGQQIAAAVGRPSFAVPTDAGRPVAHVGYTSILGKDLLRGDEPWTFLERRGTTEIPIAFGAIKRGSIRAALDVCVLPTIEHTAETWRALAAFVSRFDITDLLVESIGLPSSQVAVPTLAGEVQRYSAVKLYVMRLDAPDWDQNISSNHRRNIRKATKAGVTIVRAESDEALRAHNQLIKASLQRRAHRGEPTNLASSEEEIEMILKSGAAELYQAWLGDEIVSSKMLYTIERRYAYYDTGGTSPAGMSVGASHLLMHTMMRELHGRGIVTLNLDVASKAAGGLARFKKDFGAEEWRVDRVICDTRTPWRMGWNALRTVQRRLRWSAHQKAFGAAARRTPTTD